MLLSCQLHVLEESTLYSCLNVKKLFAQIESVCFGTLYLEIHLEIHYANQNLFLSIEFQKVFPLSTNNCKSLGLTN